MFSLSTARYHVHMDQQKIGYSESSELNTESSKSIEEQKPVTNVNIPVTMVSLDFTV